MSQYRPKQQYEELGSRMWTIKVRSVGDTIEAIVEKKGIEREGQ